MSQLRSGASPQRAQCRGHRTGKRIALAPVVAADFPRARDPRWSGCASRWHARSPLVRVRKPLAPAMHVQLCSNNGTGKETAVYLTRRGFVKLSAAVGAGAALPVLPHRMWSVALAAGLSDPAVQPKFANLVPNALDPGFIYQPDQKGRYRITISEGQTFTGLMGPRGALKTTIFGYKDGPGARRVTWPGRTFQVQKGSGETRVRWENDLPNYHLLPVDTSLHWAYSLEGYQKYSIKKNGVPIVTHVHGGHSDFQFDGNPEFFYSSDGKVTGPQWQNVPGGFTNDFRYDNNVPAGNLWYHDHALGITRLNVYAGMAGFYFVRDGIDTGTASNPLGLPAHPYEIALAVQDRMFALDGSLFYPAFPGDPFWADFITGEGLADDEVPQPSALAEFFGDHMLVNGVIWPKREVEPRNYRLRLLNGCDSRFLVLRFRVADSLTSTTLPSAGPPLTFHVIGADQGLAGSAMQTDTLVFEPGGRYDVVIDFSSLAGKRIIVENLGGDAPFGGDFGAALPPEDLFPFRQTDRVMAFDVVLPLDDQVEDNFDPDAIDHYGGNGEPVGEPREVALFEGRDEFGRLQPLLGRKAPNGNWEAIAWHSPTTELPALGSTEEWDIFNFTEDAHPVHLHLVKFQVINRRSIDFDADEENPQQVLQHNGTFGTAPAISNVQETGAVNLGPADGYTEDAPRDMVTALPGQVTRIKATFDKPGRYVWHCHILSHEDHEMMRVLQVVDAG
jgi:FtsP/CotA-like multicopper oxidase with cupredoxin domain